MNITAGVLYETVIVYPSRAHGFTPGFLMQSILIIFLVFVACVQCCLCHWIVHSWLLLSVFSNIYPRQVRSQSKDWKPDNLNIFVSNQTIGSTQDRQKSMKEWDCYTILSYVVFFLLDARRTVRETIIILMTHEQIDV